MTATITSQANPPLSPTGEVLTLATHTTAIVGGVISFAVGEPMYAAAIAVGWFAINHWAIDKYAPEARPRLDVEVHQVMSPTQLVVSDYGSQQRYIVNLVHTESEAAFGSKLYNAAMQELENACQRGRVQISRESMEGDKRNGYTAVVEIRSWHKNRKGKDGKMQYSYTDLSTHMTRKGLVSPNDVAKRLPQHINEAERMARKKGLGIHGLVGH